MSNFAKTMLFIILACSLTYTLKTKTHVTTQAASATTTPIATHQESQHAQG